MRKPLIAIMAVFSLTLIATMGFAFAAMGDHPWKGFNYDEEIHNQMIAAIESGDYEEWLRIREENDLPMRGKIFENINEENFQMYSQLHQAVQNGDTETAARIREQLGLDMEGMFRRMGPPGGHGPGMGHGPMTPPEDFCMRVCGCSPPSEG